MLDTCSNGLSCGYRSVNERSSDVSNVLSSYPSPGRWESDVPNGEGLYYYSNGDMYQGYFVKGQKHGAGTYLFKVGVAVIAGFNVPVVVLVLWTICWRPGERLVV